MFDKEKDFKNIKIILFIKVNFFKVKLMEREFTNGKMVIFMMGLGKIQENKDMVFGSIYKEIHIKDNGLIINHKDMV